MSAESYHAAMRAPLHTNDGGHQVEDGEDAPIATPEGCGEWTLAALVAGLFIALGVIAALPYLFRVTP